MPIYEYACPKGHVIDHIHRFSDGERPTTIRCEKHDATATYKIALPAVGVVAGSSNPVRAVRPPLPADASRGPRFTMEAFHCDTCAKQFDEIIDHTLNENADDGKPCPQCGLNARHVFVGSHVDETLKMYPYYNRGLDCVVESAQHVRDICKERGLIPVEGDYDAEKMYNDAARPGREAEAWYKNDMKTRWDDNDMRCFRDQYKAEHGVDFIPPF